MIKQPNTVDECRAIYELVGIQEEELPWGAGFTPIALKIAEMLNEIETLKANYSKILKAKSEMEEMYNPRDLPEPWC